MKVRFPTGKTFSAFYSDSRCESHAKAVARPRDRRRVYDAAGREQRREKDNRETGVRCQFPRARDSSQKGSSVWLRSYVGHRRAYIAAMLSANTRVRPIYPKGWGGRGLNRGVGLPCPAEWIQHAAPVRFSRLHPFRRPPPPQATSCYIPTFQPFHPLVPSSPPFPSTPTVNGR